ncbi:unnamed protein product [Rotaria magnacalcarata]|uniref:Uncharacterized protein n=1 Tax=Rotaria magnacalcarata TaxID=392030 RepID=A0A816GTR3_9BILA|nr:unnamed protein product [Rotaria magnacalcarata]
MNNHQQDEQQQVNQQEKFKMLQDLLKQIGFTDNVPLTLNYCSLPPDDKKNCLEDIKAITEHMFNIAPEEQFHESKIFFDGKLMVPKDFCSLRILHFRTQTDRQQRS